MIPDRDLVAAQRKGSHIQGTPLPRADAERYVKARTRSARRPEEWDLLPVPSCRCCGEPAWPNLRCTKHQGRDPCVVEGCRKTRRASMMGWVCGEHWRRYCPPGSAHRRAINRLVKLARKAGFKKTERWPDELEDRYWRLVSGTVRRVERLSRPGTLDEDEIKRMFGWD